MLNKILQLTFAASLTVPVFAGAATIDLPATNQTSCFDAGGGQIACAGLPGQDGDIRAGIAWPNPRFIVSASTATALTDSLTGLMWTKDGNAPDPNGVPGSACANSMGDMSWPEALAYIDCINTHSFAGFADWRLPNLNELESMVNAESVDTALNYLNASGFINVKSSTYWSATTDAHAPAFAWDVSLRTGDFPFSSAKLPAGFVRANDGRGVWPVRGTSTLPAQLWKTGQTQCFSEAGLARACSPAEAGAVSAGADWPVPRFVANAATTLAADHLTGLLWPTDTQSAGPANCSLKGQLVTWQNALVHVDCLNTNSFLGFNDWRLPNRKELRSLIDYSQQGPALPAGHPFNNAGEPFWTSTTRADLPDRAWQVSTSDGSIGGPTTKSAATLHVLPVRGPDAAPVLTMNPVASPTGLASLAVSGTIVAGTTPTVAVTVTAPATAGPVTITGTTWSSQISGLTEGAHSITVTAVDLSGNVATMTAAVTVNLPAGSFTPGAAVSILDALRALRIAVGLLPAPLAGSAEMLHGDVAPLGAPDGRIDTADALLILKKAVGLVSF